MSVFKTIAITLGTVMVLGTAIPAAFHFTSTPEEIAASDAAFKAKQDLEKARIELRLAAESCGKAVQRDLNDPNSYELVDWSRIAEGKVQIVYRARNGFNAIITATETCTFDKK